MHVEAPAVRWVYDDQLGWIQLAAAAVTAVAGLVKSKKDKKAQKKAEERAKKEAKKQREQEIALQKEADAAAAAQEAAGFGGVPTPVLIGLAVVAGAMVLPRLMRGR